MERIQYGGKTYEIDPTTFGHKIYDGDEIVDEYDGHDTDSLEDAKILVEEVIDSLNL